MKIRHGSSCLLFATLAVSCAKQNSSPTLSSHGAATACRDQLTGGEWYTTTPAPKQWTQSAGDSMGGPLAAYIHEKGYYLFFAGAERWELWAPSWSDKDAGKPLLIDDGTFAVQSDTSASCELRVVSAHPNEGADPKGELWQLSFKSADRFALDPKDPVVYQRRVSAISGPGTSKSPSLAAGPAQTEADPNDIYSGLGQPAKKTP